MDAPDAEQLVKAMAHEEIEALRGIVRQISQRYPGSEDLQLLDYLLGLVVRLTQNSIPKEGGESE